MLTLLSALAQALVEFLKLKVVSAKYDLQRRIETDLETDENQITALRARGDDGSMRVADQLYQRILRTQGFAAAADLPAPGVAAAGGAAGANGGGNLHPANG